MAFTYEGFTGNNAACNPALQLYLSLIHLTPYYSLFTILPPYQSW